MPRNKADRARVSMQNHEINYCKKIARQQITAFKSGGDLPAQDSIVRLAKSFLKVLSALKKHERK